MESVKEVDDAVALLALLRFVKADLKSERHRREEYAYEEAWKDDEDKHIASLAVEVVLKETPHEKEE